MSRRLASLALATTLVACGGPTESPVANAEPTATPTPAITPVPRPSYQQSQEIGVTFASGQFLLTIGEAVHDMRDQMLYLAIRFQNLTQSWLDVPNEGHLVVGGEEVFIYPSGALPYTPPGLSTDVVYEAVVGDADPLADGVLRWGRDDQTVTTIRLSNGQAEGFGPPIPFVADAWALIGRVTVHLTGGDLYPDAITGGLTQNGDHVIRLSLDDYHSNGSYVNGFVPMQQMVLRWPDGTTVDPLAGSPGRAPLLTWTAGAGHFVDFPVPADPAGEYDVLLASVQAVSLGDLHPELVERVPLHFAIPPLAEQGPLHAAKATADLPRVPLPVDAGSASPPSVDLGLDSGEVNLPGFAFSAQHLAWDPESATATIEGTARLLPPVVPPDDGFLDIPSQFYPNVALRVGTEFHGGLLASDIPTVTVDAPGTIAWTFPSLPVIDPDDLTLFLGVGDETAPSVLPLVPGAREVLTPTVPEEAPIEAPEVTAGNYSVQLRSYRFGLPRELDHPQAGMLALEVIMDVTAHQVEEPGPFGLLFSPADQLFIADADGYLQQSVNADLADLADGGTLRVGATFYVPATWQPQTMAFTVRNVDEIRYITRDRWVEVTFSANLLPPSGSPEPSAPPDDGGGDL